MPNWRFCGNNPMLEDGAFRVFSDALERENGSVSLPNCPFYGSNCMLEDGAEPFEFFPMRWKGKMTLQNMHGTCL